MMSAQLVATQMLKKRRMKNLITGLGVTHVPAVQVAVVRHPITLMTVLMTTTPLAQRHIARRMKMMRMRRTMTRMKTRTTKTPSKYQMKVSTKLYVTYFFR